MLLICYIIIKKKVAMKGNTCGRICKANLSNCCSDVDYTACCVSTLSCSHCFNRVTVPSRQTATEKKTRMNAS